MAANEKTDKKAEKAQKKQQKEQEQLDKQREKARAKAKKKQKKQKDKKSHAGNRDRRNVWLLVATTILVIVCIALFVPPTEKINQGLDIQGGLSVVLTANPTDGSDVTDDQMEAARSIIETRVDALGASEATVQIQGNDQILVQIPGMSDTEDALETIGKTGTLEFARLDSFTDEDEAYYIEYGYYMDEETITDDYGNTFSTGEVEYMEVEEGTYETLITGDNITDVSVGRVSEASSEYAVNITLDDEGTEAFAEATEDLVEDNGQIVIILDGEVQCAPAVQSAITDGEVSITGGYSLEDAQALETVLESGSLPVNFEYSTSQVVGPTLGQEAMTAGVTAAAIGLLLVMIYLIFFYRGCGGITAAVMAVFAVIYLGVLALLSSFGLFSLSMSGIAGCVLSIGMAADSAILSVEHFREEIRMGRSLRAASVTGVKRALITVIDADMVSLISALSLFFLASSSVKGFGLTLALGVLCALLTMVLFTVPLFRVLAPRSMKKHPKFWGVDDCLDAAATLAPAEDEDEDGEAAAAEPAEKKKLHGRFIKRDINILGHRKVFLTISAVLVCLALVCIGVRGLDFGIEFVGGSSVSFYGTGDITTEEMRDAFDAAGEEDAVIQTTETDGEAGFLVRTTTTDSEAATATATEVAESLGLTDDSFEVTVIGPDWGESVIQSSLIAFFVSIALIIVYIAIRFEYKMGLSAVAALVHNLILVIGVYALVGREVNPNTVAALLTILGYQLYDAVVVFSRVSENMKAGDSKCTFMSMANHSLNQVLVRSLNTTLTSLIPVLAMLFFGGDTLTDFAFVMAVGLVCGAYSSICVATPLFAMWKTREPKNQKLVKKYGTEVAVFEFGQPVEQTPLAEVRKAEKAARDEQRAAEKRAQKEQYEAEKAAEAQKVVDAAEADLAAATESGDAEAIEAAAAAVADAKEAAGTLDMPKKQKQPGSPKGRSRRNKK